MSIKIGNIDVSYFKVGSGDCSIYLGDTLLYPTPTGSTCYEVINDPITAYTATTYDSVYSFADSKWYMKNNLNQYEKYGVYDVVEDISSATTYEGKLAVIGTTEYQYSGGSWNNVGTYITTEVSYDIPSGYSTTYQGQTIPTTFKISVADMDVLGTRYIQIYDNTNTSYYLQITKTSYRYYGSSRITGTVTSDSDYYYFTLTDTKPSIEIYRTRGYNGTVHIITEQTTASVLYQEKDMPLAKAYQSVAAMETEVCPTVGVGQYGVVGSDVYQFDSTELWLTAGNHYKVMERSTNAANVVGCNSSSELTTGDTKPSYFNNSGITEAIIGDCTTSIGTSAFTNCTSLSSFTMGSGVTSIGSSVFRNCTSLTGITIPSGVTNINSYVFYNCTSLTDITIPSGVTSIGVYAFYSCSGLTSIDIPSGVTSINSYAFESCSSLTSITINVVTPPTLGSYAFDDTNNCPIYVPCESVNMYQLTSGWAKYTYRIQGIPPCSPFEGKWLAFYSDNHTESAACDSTSAITNGEIPSTDIVLIKVGDCVTSISKNAFRRYTSLINVLLPNTLNKLENEIFTYCTSLSSVTIPSGVTSIGRFAFAYCSGLTSVTCLATTPPTLGSNVFYDTNNCPIYVPSASVNTYKSASGWSTYASRIRAM